jgi:SAM-dependent methyltransferase
MPVELDMHVKSSSGDFVRSMFDAVRLEAGAPSTPPAVRERLKAYYTDAGLLRAWRRPYFTYHYTDAIARALDWLVTERLGGRSVTIVDLGAGLGTQSILFAAQGARVISVDIDQGALDALTIRKATYEKHFGRALDIVCVCHDVLEHDFRQYGAIDGIYSLFAFNMMQPSSAVLDRLDAAAAPGARIAIQDGNRQCALKLLLGRRRPVLSPGEFASALEERNYRVTLHRATGCIPPLGCALMPPVVTGLMDRLLRTNWRVGVSHQILAEKRLYNGSGKYAG